MKKFFLFCSFFLFLNAFAAQIPALTGPVVDGENLFDPRVAKELEVALKDFYAQSKIQLQILTVSSFDGLDAAAYALQVVDHWQLGKKGDDRGVLLLVSKSERKARIEVGTGLEADLTDLQAGRIIDRMIDFFRHEDYQDGMLFAVNMIGQTVGHKIQLNQHERHIRNRKRQSISGTLLFVIIMLSFFGRSFFPIAFIAMGGRGRMRSSSHWGGYRSSGGGWSSGGGGGWSGGGGGFSGGGASGNW